MNDYTDFNDRYTTYIVKHASIEKEAFVENIVQSAVQHIPSLAAHMPPDGAIGLIGLASKYTIARNAFKGIKALSEARTLAKRTGLGIRDGFKMRGTPRANIILGKAFPEAPSKPLQLIGKIDKGTDVASAVYNGALLAKNVF